MIDLVGASLSRWSDDRYRPQNLLGLAEMSCILNVYALPALVPPEQLSDGTAVVIDVLRASTTIVHALEAGAREVLPCQDIEKAHLLASQYPANQIVLGGERGGLLIEGFDLGNSPSEYTPFSVGEKTVIFTTSNGTQAIVKCRDARRVLIGAFVNVTAVLEQLLAEECVHLVCAGTNGDYSRDDILLAGMLVERLQRQSGLIYRMNAQALTAKENWLSSFTVPAAVGGEPLPAERLAKELRSSAGGKNLVSVGLEQDILTAAQIDQFAVVPKLVAGEMRIVAT